MGLQKKKILIVDDARLSREILKKIINETEFAIVAYEAKNGSKAISLVKNKDLDLIIIDLIMPGLSGSETIQEIRKIDENIPILIVSAVEEEKLIYDSMKFGATDFIQKPFDKKKIISKMERVLNKKGC